MPLANKKQPRQTLSRMFKGVGDVANSCAYCVGKSALQAKKKTSKQCRNLIAKKIGICVNNRNQRHLTNSQICVLSFVGNVAGYPFRAVSKQLQPRNPVARPRCTHAGRSQQINRCYVTQNGKCGNRRKKSKN